MSLSILLRPGGGGGKWGSRAEEKELRVSPDITSGSALYVLQGLEESFRLTTSQQIQSPFPQPTHLRVPLGQQWWRSPGAFDCPGEIDGHWALFPGECQCVTLANEARE